jgi:hypothetical protein
MVFGVVKNVVENAFDPKNLIGAGASFFGGPAAGFLASKVLDGQNPLDILKGGNPLDIGNMFKNLSSNLSGLNFLGAGPLSELFGGKAGQLLDNLSFDPSEILNGFGPQELLPAGGLVKSLLESENGRAILSELLSGQDGGKIEEMAKKLGISPEKLSQLLLQSQFDKALADA